MSNNPTQPHAKTFFLKDCALIPEATGIRAQSLKEFREGLEKVPAASISHHFWGRLMRPQFDEPEYNNDFASWVFRGLHDQVLAERLSMVVPAEFENDEDLRQEILEIVHQRLDESELILWSASDQAFHFLQGRRIDFDTGERFEAPEEMAPALPTFSTGSIYFHFIDARYRSPGKKNDFSVWLESFGQTYMTLVRRLDRIDPYFSSLREIRMMISRTFEHFFQGGG